MDSKNSIGYYLRPNPTDTAAEAPYLPKLVPNGVANLNDIAERIGASLPVSAERAKLLIREAFTEAIGMALQAYTVDMGALRMKARIPGSMPCEDTPFDPEANACVIELYADTELSGAFEALKLVRLSAAELATAIKVSNVTDVATMSIGEIHGTDEFIITGNGVTLDAAGESAKLVDRRTGAELATAEVVTVSKGQRATCKFNPTADGIAAGSYWLVVTTFGLIGESTPRVFRKPVTLTEAIPAPPEPIAESSDGVVKVYAVEDDAGASTPAGLLSPHGVLFVKGTGVTLQAGPSAPGVSEDVECDLDGAHCMRPGISVEQTADGISVEFGSQSGTMKNGEYPDAKLILRYYKDDAGGSPELIEVPVGIKVTMGQEDWPE